MANQLLLVDDSPLIHRVVELTFEGQDFSIHAADTPEKALALARTVKPDIIVASAEMKGAPGAEICRRLRQEGDLEETPVLLLTSPKSRMSESEARQAGAAGVLIKPFEPERLLAEVGRVLSRAAAGPDAPGEGAPEGQAGAGPAGQESPSGKELFEDHEIEALFADAQEESPAQMPAQAQDDSALLHEAEKAIDQASTPGGGAAAAPKGEPDTRLFDDSELDDLFAEEMEETPPPGAEATAPPASDEEWADLDLEADVVPQKTEPRGDLTDVAHEQASAAEAQLAEIEAELTSGGAPTEEDVQAAESEIQSLQEELSRELAGAGNIQMPKQDAPSPVEMDTDDDLLGLASAAGFGGEETGLTLDSESGEELDLEAELAAAGVGDAEEGSSAAQPVEEVPIDDLMEAGYTLPTDEEGGEPPVWDIPLKQSGEPAEEPAAEAGVSGEPDLEPLVKQSLERTVEAIVPTLIRNIEALVVRQLPDLVEKIVLREIEKIKRGE